MGPVLLFVACLADPVVWLAMLGLMGVQGFRPKWWAFLLSVVFASFVVTSALISFRNVQVGSDDYLVSFAIRAVAAAVIGGVLLLVARWWRNRALPKP